MPIILYLTRTGVWCLASTCNEISISIFEENFGDSDCYKNLQRIIWNFNDISFKCILLRHVQLYLCNEISETKMNSLGVCLIGNKNSPGWPKSQCQRAIIGKDMFLKPLISVHDPYEFELGFLCNTHGVYQEIYLKFLKSARGLSYDLHIYML